MRTIRLIEHGIMPNTDITLPLYQLFLQYPTDTEFLFENADYFFTPHKEMCADYRISNSDSAPFRVLGIWMKNMKNCILRGNGAHLWFAGHMQSFTLDHCENIKIADFTVDWKKPLVAEGVVVDRNDTQLYVSIDPDRFPHRFCGGELEFDAGAGEWYAFRHHVIAFEPHNRTVRRGTADIVLSAVSDLGNHVYALTLAEPKDIQIGDLLTLRHSPRVHANIFSEKCRDLVVEDMVFYSGGGLGCLAQFCHNLTYRRVHFLTNTAAGRYVSGGHDDGMHITSNSGTVTITECTFHALMDDPINVHGCCVTCDEVVDAQTLRCKYRHPQACGFHYWAEPGDTIDFIARGAMNSIGSASVQSYVLEDPDTFLLSFSHPLPNEILNQARAGDALALDNLTHTADFICTKNRFGSCRARGILVSVPGQVRIADNYFESSGSAILISGDSNYWFESGACHDVEISGNIFTDVCLTSYYQFCDGVISISPVVPAPELDKPYHRNIRITGNTFDCADVPVLYAYSCENLRFAENRVFKSPSAERWHSATERIRLQYCKGVTLAQNEWIGQFAATLSVAAEICDEITSDIG